MTLRLKRSDKKLLQTAVEASNGQRVSLDYLAEKTGRSVSFVYERLQDPEFRPIFIEGLKSSLVAETPAILQKFAEMGKEGSFKHGKLILEIAGVYAEESKLRVDAQVTSREAPFKDEEERAEFMRATLSKYLEEG